MNEILEKNDILIEDMIYLVRGKEVMFDTDLANLYHVETKRINEAVKNNPDKFPNNYVFRITEDEYNSLKSKISTSKGGSRKGHYAFAEQGVYMLATILKSKVATEVSIRIMDTFVKMRHYINYNKNFLPYKFMILEDKVDSNTKRIDELFDKFDPKDIASEYVFFKDDLYDAYSTVMDIFNRARKEIIIVDNYASKELLDMLRNINKKIIIVSENIDETLKKKYMKQYNNVEFIYSDYFHDRFIILDRYRLFTCGSSLKDVGKKCFAISEIEDFNFLDRILEIIDCNSNTM